MEFNQSINQSVHFLIRTANKLCRGSLAGETENHSESAEELRNNSLIVEGRNFFLARLPKRVVSWRLQRQDSWNTG